MREFSNPEAYEKRSVPRPRDEVLDSIDAFFDGVYDLAQKHGISDVGLGIQCPALLPGGGTILHAAAHIGHEGFSVELAHLLYEEMKIQSRFRRLKQQAQNRLAKRAAKGVR